MLPVRERTMNGGGIAIYASSFHGGPPPSEEPLPLRTARTPDALDALLEDPVIRAVVIEMGPATIERAAVIQSVKTRLPGMRCIVCAHPSTEEVAVAALRAGADDYVRGPVEWSAIASIARSLDVSPEPDAGGGTIVGTHAVTRKFVAHLARLAASPSTVLITGETGTGKEVAAQYIHDRSHRRRHPFVSVNCAAIPDTLLEAELFGHERGAYTGAHAAADGKFQHAHRGTLFLDEIADLTPFAQAKILRVLETREVWRLGARRGTPVDVRVIAATNQELEQLVAAGRFRADLFYRLDVARMVLPPLRERRSDIPVLIEHYVRQMNHQFNRRVAGFAPESLERLTSYNWPGNIRELRNVVEAAFVELPPRHLNLLGLPEVVRERLRMAASRPPREADQILAALEEMHWNVSRAAKRLHVSRMTVYRKLAKCGFARKGSRPGGVEGTVTPDATTVTPA